MLACGTKEAKFCDFVLFMLYVGAHVGTQ